MALEADNGEDDSSIGEFIVKIHGPRTHAYTDGLIEYRLEIAPAQPVHLVSVRIQVLRKPADTTYDILRAKKTKPKVPRSTAKASVGKGKGKPTFNSMRNSTGSDDDDNCLPTLTRAPQLMAHLRSEVSHRLATSSGIS